MGKATNAAKKAAAEVRKNIEADYREWIEREREQLAWERQHVNDLHNGVRREFKVIEPMLSEELGVVGVVRVITTNFNHHSVFGYGNNLNWEEGSQNNPAGNIELTKGYKIKGSFYDPDGWVLVLNEVIVKEIATGELLCNVEFGSLDGGFYFANDVIADKFDTMKQQDEYSGLYVARLNMITSHAKGYVGEPRDFDGKTGYTTCHDIRRREVLEELRDLWVMDELRATRRFLEI